MTTLTALDLAIDLEEFVETQGEALQRPAMQEAARQAVANAVELVSPAIVYDWLPAGRRDHDKVEVGGVVFELGRHADLLGPACLAFLAVVTIGAPLEAKSRELHASGKALDSLMLDSVGVFAVGKLIGMARSIVERGPPSAGGG